MAGLPDPQDELRNEWLRFIETERTMMEVTDWTHMKAMEYGWDFYDLAGVLMLRVGRPKIADRHAKKTEVQ